MSLIKFTNSSDNVKVGLSLDPLGRVKISFDENNLPNETTLLSGFVEINEHNFIEQSDFSDMNYIYEKVDDLTYILTKDKDDIYMEPVPFKYEDSTEDNFEFIHNSDYIPTIDEIRDIKLSNLSFICNKHIVDGVDIDIDGVIEHFSYAEEDQENIKELFDLSIQTNAPMYYHSDGNGCKLYSVDQIATIYTTAAINKMHHITYFNQLKMYLYSLNDAEIIKNIHYGYELTGVYLETYNSAMEQAIFGLKTFLKHNP